MSVTIRDVAELAQVSISTVSRAFTAPDLLREDTCERVLAAAKDLGYHPNRAARGLITGRTGNIGLIVPDLSNPFFPAVLKGAQARARESDYAVFLADAEEDPALEEELIRAMAKQVDGVVLCSSRASNSALANLAQETPLVLMNRRISGVPAVVLDSAGGARQAIDHLAALGHRRIAYVSGPSSSWSNRARRRGIKGRADAHGLDIVELGPFPPTFEGGIAAALPSLGAKVTAVFAYNDLVALGVLSELHDRSVDVPNDISVIGFDDISMARMTTPPLTTVAMPCERAGRLAIDVLAAQLGKDRHVQGGAVRDPLPAVLVVRSSTASPRSARRPGSRRSTSPRRAARG